MNQKQRGNHLPDTARSLIAIGHAAVLCAPSMRLQEICILRYQDAAFAGSETQMIGIAATAQPNFLGTDNIHAPTAQSQRDRSSNMFVEIKLNLISHAASSVWLATTMEYGASFQPRIFGLSQCHAECDRGGQNSRQEQRESLKA